LDDLTRPHLLSYDFNVNIGVLTLQLSETVPPGSVLMTSFALQNIADNSSIGPLTHFEFTGGNVSTAIISTQIVVELLKDDLDSIKALPALAGSNGTTFLTMTKNGVEDVSGNKVIAVTADAATPVVEYVADVTSPELVSFTLNLDSGVVLASFSETVNGSSFDPSEITVQSVSNGTKAGALSHNLRGGWNVSTAFSVNVSFVLLKDDLDVLKVTNGLATEESDTFFSVSSALVSDMNRNPLTVIAVADALQSTSTAEDETAPIVVQFTFDLNAGLVNLSMSEPMTDAINVTELTFVSTGDTTGYALTSSSNATLADGQRLVQIALSITDLDQIKARPSLATASSNTVLQLGAGFGYDKNFNNVGSLSLSSSRTPVKYEEDKTPPSLLSFVLDLRTNQLRLTFSEAINSTSFDPTAIMLLGAQTNSVSSYNLTGGTVSNDSKRCHFP